MYRGRRFLAIIPARAGSKGIINKNLMEIQGKSLIQYTLDEAHRSKYLDEVLVSTESPEYKAIIEELGGKVPFLRPRELAGDDSPSIDAVIYTIEYLENNYGQVYDYVVLLQPTSPLRQAKHIDEAIELIVEQGASSLVSVNPVEDHPYLIRSMDEQGRLHNILARNSTMPRQNLPLYYKVNGAIYIQLLINHNLARDISFNDGELGYVMPRELSLDIDNIEDVRRMEAYLANFHSYALDKKDLN